MKFISWNVNGLRACVGKDFEQQFKDLDADFFCLQETKMLSVFLVMNLIGITLTRRAILVRQYTQSISH